MKLDERIQQRFNELEQATNQVRIVGLDYDKHVDRESWQKWSTSVLNLLSTAFGPQSVHFQNFKKIHDDYRGHTWDFEAARGVFHAAKEDYEGGYVFSLEKAVSGEVFGDFVLLAEKSLAEGHKDVAAVLACAALEDALKRFAQAEGLNVDNADMQQVVNALKSERLVSGAQKTLLDTMPKIRDWAMHANWEKIRPEDVSGVIGFVKQFLLEKF
ncbi:MAG: DUF4145 domain-containing protein [Syntrophobacteraceae bacterium]